jgi:tetratricopeptide (TPR) repeat protein
MRSREIMQMASNLAIGILLSMLLAGEIPTMSLFAYQSESPASLGKMKSMAEAQHEIVSILIKKKEYDKASAEANKIFDMKWPNDQEPLLLEELLNLTKQFHQQGQALLGINLIDRNQKVFKKPSSQAAILKEKGYLHKSLNQNDRALDCFRKARDLEGAN